MAGGAAGSMVAAIQIPTIAAGSLFAIAQSAGATGTVAAIGVAGVTVGSMLAAHKIPTTVAGVGFGVAGVTVESIAAIIQTPLIIAAGSFFALVQSARANGIGVGFGVCLLIGGGAIAGALLAPLVLPALGFGAAGIIAGSWAAAIQTPFTVAGSWFAFFQSAGATGIAVCTAVKVAGATAGATVGATVGALSGALLMYVSFR